MKSWSNGLRFPLVLLLGLFLLCFSTLPSFCQDSTAQPSNSSPTSISQASSSESPTAPQPQVPQPLVLPPPTPLLQDSKPLPPLPAQLPPGMTPEQAKQLLTALWPTIVDFSINSDKLPSLASQSLTFLTSSQQIAVGQSSSISSGQQASSSAEQNASSANQSAQQAASSASSAQQESQTAATQAQASAAASGAAAAPLGDAKIQADALATEIMVLKIGIVTVSVVAAGEGAFILGHVLKAW